MPSGINNKSRIVSGLSWARPCQRPAWARASRKRGALAEGLRYEKLVAKALPEALHGQWFEFKDANGFGICQTDLLFAIPGHIFILECKYTDTPTAKRQLIGLYLPVVRMALGHQTHGLIVAKRLIPESLNVTDDFSIALALAQKGTIPVLQWLGNKSLAPLSKQSHPKPTPTLDSMAYRP